jgi:hypothetical protein
MGSAVQEARLNNAKPIALDPGSLGRRAQPRIVNPIAPTLMFGGGGATLAISNGPDFGTFSIGQLEIPLIATGGTGTYVWSTSGTLPPGMALRTDVASWFPSNASAGLIGVATTPGNYSFVLHVQSGAETADLVVTRLRITSLRVKDSYRLPDAFVGVFYTYTLTALGNAAAVTWTPEPSFPVPAGLTLAPNGVLSGIPTTPNGFNPNNFNFSFSDGTDTLYQGLNLRVSAIEITTPGVLPNATQNASYVASVAAFGGTGSYTFTANGLPNGLSMNSAGGISGIANTGAAKFSVNVTATDTNNASYTKSMSLDVIGVPPVLPSLNPYGSYFDDCTVGVACSRGISVTNGTAPFSWTASGLPAGMSIRNLGRAQRAQLLQRAAHRDRRHGRDGDQ